MRFLIKSQIKNDDEMTVTYGLGRVTKCHWAMARMEWLALQGLMQMKSLLSGIADGMCTMLDMLEFIPGAKKDIRLDICWGICIPPNV